jgi:hypothetical protein
MAIYSVFYFSSDGRKLADFDPDTSDAELARIAREQVRSKSAEWAKAVESDPVRGRITWIHEGEIDCASPSWATRVPSAVEPDDEQPAEDVYSDAYVSGPSAAWARR